MNFTDIKEALMAVTRSIKEADGPATMQALDRIERFLQAHREEIHPQLAHFLERRSYAKALLWLQSGRPVGKGEGDFGDVA